MISLLKTILSTIPNLHVAEARIDPYKQDLLPACSVKYAGEDMDLKGNDPIYQNTTKVVIEVMVADSETYYTDIKTIVDTIKHTILTNPTLYNQVEWLTPIRILYDYVDGGETNIAAAQIQLSYQVSEIFQPTITNNFATAGIDLDDGSPFDTNLATDGPDGRIEIHGILPIPLQT